ncbi:MAG: hypothetical protein BGO26_16790 [Actinobacteria bacterium 69-20]|nr:DUF2249 domain-containing protein [Actinomycetota bacterium]OJV27123.1 MAG: hypothetical protein BGO26_16790 [Actinobacteria bacterium 69-20]
MTTSLAVATNEADSAALDAITQHHAELVGTVVAHATALLDASSSGSLEGASNARRDLVLFCRGELLPHAIAEEDTLYALARELPGGALLIDAMIADHRVLAELIDDLAGATTPLGASAAAHALRVLFELHVEKENDYVLPALAAAGEVSLAAGLERMHEQFEELRSAATGGGCGCGGGGCGCGGGAGHGHAEPAGQAGGCGCGGGGCGSGGGYEEADAAGGGCGCGGGGCGCGDSHDVSETAAYDDVPGEAPVASRPVLDARQVPHHIRHATVFGALDAVRPGAGLELIAPHDPLPLLAQIEERDPGAFEISYLERGPEAWRIALDRRVTAAAAV